MTLILVGLSCINHGTPFMNSLTALFIIKANSISETFKPIVINNHIISVTPFLFAKLLLVIKDGRVLCSCNLCSQLLIKCWLSPLE